MGSSTENSAFGPLEEPARPHQGAGRVVAAAARWRWPPASRRSALGSDTGGSIRQPAALCGVVGMKPTYGRVSRYGLVAFASSLDQIGPFAATVADAAALYDVIAGHDPCDSTSIPEASRRRSLDVLDQGVDGLRVGLVTELLPGRGHRRRRHGRVQAAAEALGDAGAKVDEVSVPAAIYGLSAYYLIAPAEASQQPRPLRRRPLRPAGRRRRPPARCTTPPAPPASAPR